MLLLSCSELQAFVTDMLLLSSLLASYMLLTLWQASLQSPPLARLGGLLAPVHGLCELL